MHWLAHTQLAAYQATSLAPSWPLDERIAPSLARPNVGNVAAPRLVRRKLSVMTSGYLSVLLLRFFVGMPGLLATH
jgi:hypothetical protein